MNTLISLVAKPLYPVCFLLACLPLISLSAQTTYTWIGPDDEFASNSWTNPDNWLEGTPVGGANTHLLFGQANHNLPYNDIPSFRLKTLTFGALAGQYVISGDRIDINAGSGQGIFNNSLYRQTLETPLHLIGSSYTIFNSGRNGLVLSGDISGSIGHFLLKDGSGDLTLQGDLSGIPTDPVWNTEPTMLLESGRLIVDMENGGMLKSNMNIQFGDYSYGVKGSRTAELVFMGKSTERTTVLLGDFYTEAYQHGVAPMGLGRITVDANGGPGVDLEIKAWTRAGMYHFDLSSGNATVSVTGTKPGMSNGVVVLATITDTVKTGFVTFNGDFIERYEGHTPLPANNQNNGTTHFSTSGNLTLTNGHWNVNTLTIQGGGILDGAPVNNRFGLNNGLLMEEGVSDYTIDVLEFGFSGGSPKIFQYSTVGNLIINSALTSTNLHKVGPGLVILNHATSSVMTGSLLIQEGPLRLNGGVTRVANVYVYNRATLLGQGTIGGGGDVEDIRYTPVRILDGGTLDASNHESRALSIHGTLRLDDEATYKMVLRDNTHAPLHVTGNPLAVDPVVNLSGDLSLSLAEDYVHILGDWIYLLTTDGAIAGQFLTVNNQYFTGALADEFLLGAHGFRLVYDHDLGGGITAVALQAIPEPSTVALLAGLALGVIWLHRRKAC